MQLFQINLTKDTDTYLGYTKAEDFLGEVRNDT